MPGVKCLVETGVAGDTADLLIIINPPANHHLTASQLHYRPTWAVSRPGGSEIKHFEKHAKIFTKNFLAKNRGKKKETKEEKRRKFVKC